MQFRVSLRSKAGLVTSADIANSSEVQNRRWIWNQSLFCRLWLRFPTPWTLKGRLVHVRTGKQERKARRKEEKKEGKKCASAGSCYVAPLYGDHTGSRATEWLTEFNQRGHTCMIEACFYVALVVGSFRHGCRTEKCWVSNRYGLEHGMNHLDHLKQPQTLGWQVGYVLNHCWSRYVVRRPWRYPRITWGASLDGASCVLSIPLLFVLIFS